MRKPTVTTLADGTKIYPIRVHEVVLLNFPHVTKIEWGQPDEEGFYTPTVYTAFRRSPGTGSVYQTPRGWRGALQSHGKRRYVYGTTKEIAEQRLNDLIVRLG